MSRHEASINVGIAPAAPNRDPAVEFHCQMAIGRYLDRLLPRELYQQPATLAECNGLCCRFVSELIEEEAPRGYLFEFVYVYHHRNPYEKLAPVVRIGFIFDPRCPKPSHVEIY